MTTLAGSISRAATTPEPSPRWIVSRSADLIWFQGSVLIGIALLALFAWLPRLDRASYAPTHPAVLVLLAWGVLLDGTHVFGTYVRSYLAPDAGSRAALPGRWSYGVVLAGPAIALVDHLVCVQSPSLIGNAGALFQSYLAGAYLWAYWHLVRQHYGFLVLYQRRAGHGVEAVARLEVVLLWVGCLHPFVRFSLSEAYLRSGLPVLFPAALAPSLTRALDGAALSLAVAGGALLLVRLRGHFAPRHLLLVVVVGFHQLAFATLDNLLAITATLTAFHNLQYHRIVWQYERGKGRRPAGGLARYLGFGVALGAGWYGARILGVALLRGDLARNLLLGLGWGVAFHHYLVDGRIWRVRRSRDVARAIEAGATA